MTSKSNVFDYRTHDTCTSRSCANLTQHKSGLCLACRTKQCMHCGKTVVKSITTDLTKPICAYCRQKGKGRPK